jgi:hypothetical protein|tara:strand:+ start:6712 stop:6918 length:207 start_codon:yes stop_codon:yes gene_type:complete
MALKEERLKTIITDYKTKSNGELKFALEELSEDYETTKNMIVKLTYHLDSVEKIYTDILTEYKDRGNK